MNEITNAHKRASSIPPGGGEEFAVLCRGITLHNASVLAERLRSMVEQAQFQFDGRLIPVTISIGVAAYPYASVQNGTELIGIADEALYEAKRTGRNRVVMKR